MTPDEQPLIPHPGLDALRRYQYVPPGTKPAPQVAPVVPAYMPTPPRSANRPGTFRRVLSYVAVVWGGLSVLLILHQLGSSSSSAQHGGNILGLGLAGALLILGGREILSGHLLRFRVLPWLMGVEVALVALAVVAVIALRGMYPDSVRSTFLANCEAQGSAPTFCGCALNWFESHKTLAQFIAVDAEARVAGQLPPDVMQGIAASCPR